MVDSHDLSTSPIYISAGRARFDQRNVLRPQYFFEPNSEWLSIWVLAFLDLRRPSTIASATPAQLADSLFAVRTSLSTFVQAKHDSTSESCSGSRCNCQPTYEGLCFES